MATKHLSAAARSTVRTRQTEPMRGDQVKNSAGGYSWAVDKWTHLRRFLVLGTAGGTYYISQRDLTKEGLDTLKAVISEDGRRTVDEILAISEAGRAPKNDYALFSLATVVAFGDEESKRYALENLDKVARIGTHLFQFVNYLEGFGCLTGRAKRRALARWYTTKSVDKVAYQLIKYRNREGWTHRDVLRIAHPGSIEPVEPHHAQLFRWVAKDESPTYGTIIDGFIAAQESESPKRTAELIAEYNLPREALKTEHLNDPIVWEAMLEAGMPLGAMIRNLGVMTKNGVLTSQSPATKIVVNALGNDEAIRKARIHPLNVLFAMRTYASGQGFRGSNSWSPVTKIVDALDGTFYKAFGNVEPTGKRIMLALDISGSMVQYIGGTAVTCYEAEAAMALVTETVEDDVTIMGFNTNFEVLNISSRQRLTDATAAIMRRGFGGTDCSLPMIYAGKKGLEIDAFVVYTDSETWAGRQHPAQALKAYRKSSGIDSKLIVVGMTANKFSIAEPEDAGMLDVVGFDTSAPNIMSDFIAGRI